MDACNKCYFDDSDIAPGCRPSFPVLLSELSAAKIPSHLSVQENPLESRDSHMVSYISVRTNQSQLCGQWVCVCCVRLSCLPAIILFNLAVKGWPWPRRVGKVEDLAAASVWMQVSRRTSRSRSGANHCLLESFPLFSELLSRTALGGRRR